MAKPKKVGSRRKKDGNNRPLLILLVLVVLIGAIFYFLEQSRTLVPLKSTEPTSVLEHQKLPPREVIPPIQQKSYTTAVTSIRQMTKRPKSSGPGTLSIIIDDMGSNMQEARLLLGIKLPITFAVIPNLARSKAVAEAVHAEGREVMVHMPMEPKGYPQQRMEPNGLLISLSEGEIEGRVTAYIQAVPFAVGANNHMGSHFTEFETKMQPVLRMLKGHDMFFVDSMTSSNSVGYRLAREMGVLTGTRQVFLDNVQEPAAIKKQLEQAAAIARKKRGAIAICHPHKVTIQVLTEMMPALSKSGITFVYASQLVH